MKREKLHVYYTDDSRTKLERLARAHRRTLSAEVVALIDEAYKKHVSDITNSKDELLR